MEASVAQISSSDVPSWKKRLNTMRQAGRPLHGAENSSKRRRQVL
jgi:hypothetical protein